MMRAVPPPFARFGEPWCLFLVFVRDSGESIGEKDVAVDVYDPRQGQSASDT
jgi:hypothetical protein